MTHNAGKYRNASLFVGLFVAASIFQHHLARAQSLSPAVEELQHQISKRDAVITDLMRRVEALEQRLGKTAVPDQPTTSDTAKSN